MKNMSARARKSLKCVAIVLSVIFAGGVLFSPLFALPRNLHN